MNPSAFFNVLHFVPPSGSVAGIAQECLNYLYTVRDVPTGRSIANQHYFNIFMEYYCIKARKPWFSTLLPEKKSRETKNSARSAHYSAKNPQKKVRCLKVFRHKVRPTVSG